MGRAIETGSKDWAPFTEDEVLPFTGDMKLVRSVLKVQERIKEASIAKAIRWTIFLGIKRPSVEKLADTFEVSRRKVEAILKRENLQTNPIPQVKKDPLPGNERAFFTGLSLGKLQFDIVNWSGHHFVVVGTESADSRKHDLIRHTFGLWGEVRGASYKDRKKSETKVYLDADTFGFVTGGKGVGSSILLSHKEYPPFLRGFMAIKLIDAKDRLSLDNPEQLASIHRNCERHLGISLGRFHIEKRPEGRLGVVDIKHSEEIYAVLAQVETVSRLPYFRQLTQIAA